MNFKELHTKFKEPKLLERYIALNDIEPLLNGVNLKSQVSIIGKSVLNQPIYKCKIGNGAIKILMWSQMHGDESTTTKSLFDFFNFINSNDDLALLFKTNFTLCFIPILNPDGATAYTRENANGIDLNRDSQNQSQPESIILRSLYNEFKPDYCFNLHDQRSIYGAGDSGKPAFVSFLAPAYNISCDYNTSRLKAVSVINAVNIELQKEFPGCIGRFNDEFNFNCVGDTFQFLNTPTILFEAGHYGSDYKRETPRKAIFTGFLVALNHIYENVIVTNVLNNYLRIPQNKVNFYDIICRNANIYFDNSKKNINFALQYTELLIDGKVKFQAYLVKIDDLENCFGHLEIESKNCEIILPNNRFVLEEPITIKIGTTLQFENGFKIE